MSVLEEKLFQTAAGAAWRKIGVRDHHGINVPLISIYTSRSCGNGEFYDLIPLIDWCAQVGMDIIQLLPFHESGHDPSPYNALSSCALHPIYLSLSQLPYLPAISELRGELKTLAPLNHTTRIDYPQVCAKKRSWLKKYVDRYGSIVLKEAGYQEFCVTAPWLREYLLFKILKGVFHYKHWREWSVSRKSMSILEEDQWLSRCRQEVEYYSILQYLCFQQCRAIKAYANDHGVLIKGDLPILISPDSVDVWAHPQYFDLSLAAGSPPNAFNPGGQYWGFPIYRWQTLHENGYDWWKMRLQVAQKLYDLYRLDHIMGFLRIWAIPIDKPPSEGEFLPGKRRLYPYGKEALATLTRFTDLLPIGEDLGTPPKYLKPMLRSLGICGTHVLRWERERKGEGPFLDPNHFNPISLSSVSTHDTDTVTLWWKNHPKDAKLYAKMKGWVYRSHLSYEQHFELLWEVHHSGSLFHINLLQEYLALTPHLTWKDPELERVNIPGTFNAFNWTYRYKNSVEMLTKDPQLGDCVTQLTRKTNGQNKYCISPSSTFS